jgi:hypothetical protein
MLHPRAPLQQSVRCVQVWISDGASGRQASSSRGAKPIPECVASCVWQLIAAQGMYVVGVHVHMQLDPTTTEGPEILLSPEFGLLFPRNSSSTNYQDCASKESRSRFQGIRCRSREARAKGARPRRKHWGRQAFAQKPRWRCNNANPRTNRRGGGSIRHLDAVVNILVCIPILQSRVRYATWSVSGIVNLACCQPHLRLKNNTRCVPEYDLH